MYSQFFLRNICFYIIIFCIKSFLIRVYYNYLNIDSALIVVFTSLSMRNTLPLKHSLAWLEAKKHLHRHPVEICY